MIEVLFLTVCVLYSSLGRIFSLLFSDFCGMTFFYTNRPKHVKLNSDLPHDMCMCIYHSNFIEPVDALHKYVPSLPDYKNGFVQLFLCDESSMDCFEV